MLDKNGESSQVHKYANIVLHRYLFLMVFITCPTMYAVAKTIVMNLYGILDLASVSLCESCSFEFDC